MSAVRPRRSVLFMPGSNARAVEKARTLPCDAVIIDLEDAVAPDAKDLARDQACAAVTAGGFGGREVVVRINGEDTPWHEKDLAAVCAAAPDGIAIPKVVSAAQVSALVSALDRAGAPEELAVWGMVETPAAILACREIAAASPRLKVIVVGTNDLTRELRTVSVPGRAPLMTSLSLAVLGARAAGKTILDGVYNDVRDADGFAAECRQGRDLGFDGKSLIHPSQIEPCNVAFSPSEADVEWSRRVLAAWDDMLASGRGVATLDGKLIENLHVATARDILALHEVAG